MKLKKFALAVVLTLIALFIAVPSKASPTLIVSSLTGNFSASTSAAIDIKFEVSGFANSAPFTIEVNDPTRSTLFDLELSGSETNLASVAEIRNSGIGTHGGYSQLDQNWGLYQGRRGSQDGSYRLHLPLDSSVNLLRIVNTSRLSSSHEVKVWQDLDADGILDVSEPNSSLSLDFVSNAVAFKVTNEETGLPLANQFIQIQQDGGSHFSYAWSDASGSATLWEYPHGTYQYQVLSSSNDESRAQSRYMNSTRETLVIATDSQVIEVALKPYPNGTRSFSGRITSDGDGTLFRVRLDCDYSSVGVYFFKTLPLSANGSFEFSSLPNLSCTVFIDHDQYLTYRTKVDLVNNSAVDLGELSLLPKGTATVSGLVLDAETSEPVVGTTAFVRLDNGTSYFYASGTTDEDGEFVISNVPAGTVKIGVTAKQSAPKYLSLNEAPFDVVQGTVLYPLLLQSPQATGSRSISISATTPSGRPLANTWINIDLLTGDGGWFSQLTDSQGRLQVEDLPDGRYAIGYYGQQYLYYRTEITLSGSDAELNIPMRDKGTRRVTGKVITSETGSPAVSGIYLYLSHSQGNYYWNGSASTDETGNFVISGVPDGISTIDVDTWTRQGQFFSFQGREIRVTGQDVEFSPVLDRYPTGTRAINLAFEQTPSGRFPDAQLNCSVAGRTATYRPVSTSSNNIIFSGLPSLQCDLWIVSPDYLQINKRVDLRNSSFTQYVTLVPAGSSTVSGVIRSRATNLPVSGAQVHLSYAQGESSWHGFAQTAADGSYSIAKAPTGTLQLGVSPNSPDNRYYSTNSIAVLVDSPLETINVLLQPTPTGTATASGKVIRSTGEAIANAHIQLSLQGSSPWFSSHVNTDSLGNFSIGTLPAGTYDVWINAPGFLGRNKQVKLSSGQTTAFETSLTAEGIFELSGRVTSDDGDDSPVAGAYVSVQLNDGINTLGRGAHTDSNGEYSISRLPDGDFTLNVWPQGESRYFEFESSNFSIQGSNKTLDLELEPYPAGTATLTGLVSDDLGNALENVYVSLHCETEEGRNLNYSDQTDSSGLYRIERLPACDYDFHTWKDNYPYVSTALTIASTARIYNVELPAPTGATLSGTITGRISGNPVADIAVYVSWQDGPVRISKTAVTDEDGHYEISNVPTADLGGRFSLNFWWNSDSNPEGYILPEAVGNAPAGTETRDYELEQIPQGSATLSGRVYVKGTTNPIEGAQVRLNYDYEYAPNRWTYASRTSTTDAQGKYSFGRILNNQSYNLSARGPEGDRYIQAYINVSIASTELTKSKDFYLEELPVGFGSLTGQILDQDGNPISRAWIHLWRVNGGDVNHSVRTSATGYYEFSELPYGEYHISPWVEKQVAGRQKYKSLDWDTGRVTFPDNNTHLVKDITLESYPTGSAAITGQVWDATRDEPVRDVYVYLSGNWEHFPGDSVRTDKFGRFTFDNLPDGGFQLGYETGTTARFYILPEQQFTEVEGDDVDLGRIELNSVQLDRATLRLTVRDKVGYSPIAGADVTVRLKNSNGYAVDGVTDRKGKILFTGLPAGEVEIYVNKNGFITPTRTPVTTLSVGTNSAKVELEDLRAVGTISGVVEDVYGNPVEDAWVSATYEIRIGCCEGDGGGPTTKTDALGRYVLSEVPLERDLTFRVDPDANGANATGLTPYSERVFLLAAGPSASRSVVLSEGANLYGSVVAPAGSNLNNVYVNVIDAVTGAWRASALVDQAGNYAITNIPSDDNQSFTARLYFSQESWPQSTAQIQRGFYRSISLTESALVADSSQATLVTITPGQDTSLTKKTFLRRGGAITGNVKLQIGARAVSYYQKSIMVTPYRKVGSSWVAMDFMTSYWAEGYSGGGYVVGGLPEGEYKLEFSDVWNEDSSKALQTLFNGSSLTLDNAPIIAVTAGAVHSESPVIMGVPQPVSVPTVIDLDNLDDATVTALEDQVAAPGVVQPGSPIAVSVGEEYAGQWVAVTIDEGPSVQSSAFTLGNPFAFMRMRALALSSTTTWLQVQDDGTVSVPGTSVLGSKKIVVQDADNSVMGWTAVQVSQAVSTPTAPMLGGGGGGFLPPANTASPTISSYTSVSFEVKGKRYLQVEGSHLNMVSRVEIGTEEALIITQSPSLILIEVPLMPDGIYDLTVRWSTKLIWMEKAIRLVTGNQQDELPMPTEPEVETNQGKKMSIGTFKGFVAIYLKGLKGQRVSIKIAGKWILVKAVPSDFYRLVRNTGAGYTVNSQIFINKKMVQEKTLVTK